MSEAIPINCPACGKPLTAANNDELCSKSLLPSGLHPIMIFEQSERWPWEQTAESRVDWPIVSSSLSSK